LRRKSSRRKSKNEHEQLDKSARQFSRANALMIALGLVDLAAEKEGEVKVTMKDQ
jgi:hypothetical protein